MKLYLIFTRKGLAVILALTILALIIIGQFSSVNRSYSDGSSHQKRMEFLAAYKISVNENDVSVKETRLPQKMSGHFNEYNETVLKGGFDLSDFCGKNVTVYSYALSEKPQSVVSLVVADGKIIAGDITDTLKGVCFPLVKEK